MPEKIPVELLLKYSRREVGELKSDISELQDAIKQKNKEIEKLELKIRKLQKLNNKRSPQVQVEDQLKDLEAQLHNVHISKPEKRTKKLVNLYKRSARTYNYWFDGCKQLIPFLEKLKNTNFS